MTWLAAAACGGCLAFLAGWLTFRFAVGSTSSWLRWTVPAAAYATVLSAVAGSRLQLSVGLAVFLAEAAVLTHVAILDLKRQLVLNVVTYPGTVVAVILAPLTPGLSWLSAASGGLGAAAPFLAVSLLRPEGLGMGDVKLAFMIGAMAGLWPGGRVLYAVGAGLASALAAAFLLLGTRRARATTPLPIGAFLAISAAGTLAVLNA
jgi:leader peptidase (prepilin peptidase)/N-methyltransferase